MGDRASDIDTAVRAAIEARFRQFGAVITRGSATPLTLATVDKPGGVYLAVNEAVPRVLTLSALYSALTAADVVLDAAPAWTNSGLHVPIGAGESWIVEHWLMFEASKEATAATVNIRVGAPAAPSRRIYARGKGVRTNPPNAALDGDREFTELLTNPATEYFNHVSGDDINAGSRWFAWAGDSLVADERGPLIIRTSIMGATADGFLSLDVRPGVNHTWSLRAGSYVHARRVG